jgi:imidazolonepropionase-like amidohydrolase
MEPMDVLVAATRNSALVAGLGEELGTVEVGKRADILVVDGDPLGDIQTLTRPVLVLRDGAVVRDMP